MARLTAKADEMVSLFSRTRDRLPMRTVLASWFESVTFPELTNLDPREQRAAIEFYERVADLRWYVTYTEDMPGQIRASVSHFQGHLESAFRTLIATLGPPEAEGVPVVQATVVSRKGPQKSRRPHLKRRRPKNRPNE
jgi:hypothetical protein